MISYLALTRQTVCRVYDGTVVKIKKNIEDAKLTVAPVGRLDHITAPKLEEKLLFEGINELVFDFSEVDNITSSGLRVLLAAQKRMVGKKMVIANVRPMVKEIFDITGFSDVFTFA